MTLYLVRHGRCEGTGYVGRGSDVPLTEPGRRDMEALGTRLRTEAAGPVEILCSSLLRARESAGLLARALNYPGALREDDRLDEMDFGSWEGMDYKSLEALFPKQWEAWLEDTWNNSPPGGERGRSMAERVESFYRDLRKDIRAGEGSLVIVAHGGSLRMLLCLFLGLPPQRQWAIRIDRGGMATVEMAGDLPVLKGLS